MKTTVTTSNTILEGLETCLLILQDAVDDPMCEDALACISCYQLASDCHCKLDEQVLWPTKFAIDLLKAIVDELQCN